MKITKTQFRIKEELITGKKDYIINRDKLYFVDYGRLNQIREFTNKYGEKITSLGFQLADTDDMYFQHLFDRYPEKLKILRESKEPVKDDKQQILFNH